MKFTYYGHSCFAVETAGKHLLFDPCIIPNELAKSVKLDAIKADYILLTHGHVDHVGDAVALARSTGATVVASFEVATWINQQGIEKTHPLNIGGGWNFDFGRVKMTMAVHSSAMPDGSNGGNPGGFVVETNEGAFYYAGDTALTLDMQLVSDEFALKFAVLPIGDNFTMGAKDAARAAKLLKCDQVFGVHYDTFPYIRIDRAAATEEFARAGVKLHLPPIGGSMTL